MNKQEQTNRVATIPHSGFRIPDLEVSHSLLAWAGWRLEMPREWQPLKLTGTPDKGQMIVGNSACAMFSVNWERLKRAPLLDGCQWVTERIKRHGVLPDRTPPGAEHFTACGWAHGLQTEEDKQTTYWYGYAERARLVLGVTVNGVLPAPLRAQITGKVLPSLRTSPADEDSIWSMYNVSFVAPAGYQLLQRHLYSGDVALEFGKGRKKMLLLRQVYPGDLALGRRSFERWLEAYPFKEHRRLRRASKTIEPWQHNSRAELTGVQRRGWKRLAIPLGGVSPRRTYAVAAHDQRLNRLLIAEHLVVTEMDDTVCAAAIERMNQAGREGR